MNCLYHSFKQCRWFRVMMLALFSIVASAASAETIDLGELELDKVYNIPDDFNDYIGHVTAPKTGVLTYLNGNVSFNVYADAEHENQLTTSYGGYVNGALSYSLNVTQGEVYYFYLNFSMNAGTFKVSMSNELSLRSATVDEGAQLSASGRGAIVYTFNQSIAVDGVTFASGSNVATLSTDAETYRVSGANLTVEYGAILSNWYEQGLVKEGDPLTVTVSGLRSYSDESIMYKGTGDFTASYVAAGVPVTLVSATTGDGKYTLTNTQYAPCNFLSYFKSTNPDGKYIFTFSDPIDTTQGTYQLQFGSQEADDWYVENLTPVFSNDNKTLTFDLTGKKRDYKEMSNLGYNYGEIYLSFGHLTAADGQLVYTGVSGSEGSFTFPFKYSVVTSSATAEFTPSDKLADQIEIYVSNYDQIEYDGVKFSWTKNRQVNEVVVPLSQLSIETDDFNGAAITVTVPEEVKSLSNVTVTLSNLLFADGEEHADAIINVYNKVDSQYATDLNYTYTPNYEAAVESCDQLTITFPDYTKVMYGSGQALMSGRSSTTYVSLDAATEGATGSQMIQPIKGATNNDYYTVTFPEGYFELDDNLYSPEFSATFAVYSEKTTDQGSVVTSPANGAVVDACDEIVVTFNDYDGVACSWENKATISKDGGDAQELGDAEWGDNDNEMKQPLGGLAAENGSYTVTFPARYFVLGEAGNDFSEEIVVNFTVGSAQEATFNVTSNPESGSTVESCDQLELTFPDYGIVNIGAGKATISRRGDIEYGEKELGDARYGTELNEAVQPLGGLAEEEGMYIVTFPAGYFSLGENEDDPNPVDAPEFYITFIVEKAKEVVFNVTSNPESGSTVESCDQLELTFPDYGIVNIGAGKATISRRGDIEYGEKELGDAGYGTELNEAVQPLGGLAEEEGMYIVTFPAGYFTLGENEDDANPVDAPEFYITFIVEGAKAEVTLDVTSNPESGSTVESCDQLELTFNGYFAAGNGFGTATISRRGDAEYGEKELPSAEFGTGWNQMVQQLNGLAEEEGMYIVNFPEGYFELTATEEDDENDVRVSSPAFVITFIVEKAKAEVTLDVTSNPESGSTVESCDQLELTFNGYFAAGNGFGTATISRRGDFEYGEKELPSAEFGTGWNQMVQQLNGLAEEEGMYIVSFPEGYFELTATEEDDENNVRVSSPAFVITFIVEEAKAEVTLDVTSNPESGSTVESCDQLELTFNGYFAAGNGFGTATISRRGDFEYGEKELPSAEFGTGWNQMVQQLNGLAEEEGMYIVSFPEGYFELTATEEDDENNVRVSSPAFVITFIVEEAKAEVTLDVTSNPESGSTVESCDQLELTFNGYFAAGNGFGTATISRRGDFEYGEKELPSAEFGTGWNQMVQQLNGLAEEEGMYIVSFPEGYFELTATEEDDENNVRVSSPAFVITFIVEKPVTLNVTTTPAHGTTVTSCDEIDIIFDDYEEVGYSWWGTATISKDGGEAQALPEPEIGTLYNEMKQPLNGLASDNAEYTVSFPEGYFNGDEAHNYDGLPAFSITFTVSASDGITNVTVNGAADVEYYNLNGVQVINPAKGVYIVKRGQTVTKEAIK